MAKKQLIVRDKNGQKFAKGTTEAEKEVFKRARKNMELRQYIDKESIELIDTALRLAKKGSEPMLKLMIDKVVPNIKYDTVNIQLIAKINRMEDVVDASGEILKHMCDGLISPEQAKVVSDILDRHASNIEKRDLVGRIERLEEVLKLDSGNSDVEIIDEIEED